MSFEQPHDETSSSEQSGDPIFRHEQRHLSETHATLRAMEASLSDRIRHTEQAAADDKRTMGEELSPNFASYADAMETYADFATMNRVIDGYNAAQNMNMEKLARIHLLLKQPYFAKVVLQYKSDEKPKELYIGSVGISDDGYKRMVVDWRSPVAETYYNQDNGPTSYVANGRTISVDLKLRRQFDIEGDVLNAYFDTSVAIQDSLLLASLSKRRTARMQAITATIQKEQNRVVRHEDVPVLLVNGIAGSGKTSVLLQRIAYLFYRNRETLDAGEVFLITPNPVFGRYIDNVLPDLGERNPETLTWTEFAAGLMPPDRAAGDVTTPLCTLARIDDLLATFEFDQDDFKDIKVQGERVVSAQQVRQISAKFAKTPAGPHRVTLMREELIKRLESRIGQKAATEAVHDELTALDTEEQLRLFHETIAPQTEEELRDYALIFLNDRYASAVRAVENDDWLRIDRIGMRLLAIPSLDPTTWLYLKMALTGLGNPSAKYVMIDEVQDYTAAQLAVIARFYRRAHFLLLGDENQAIKADTASFQEVREVFSRQHGAVETCHLMTSYRSSPEITDLFARLITDGERMRISSIQRAQIAPEIIVCPTGEKYTASLRHVVETAARDEGLTAIIVPRKYDAGHLEALAGTACPKLIGQDDTLPESGVVLITLKLAKGLEFDHVIIPDASSRVFPEDDLARRRLYTTISRATRKITLIAQNELTPLLER